MRSMVRAVWTIGVFVALVASSTEGWASPYPLEQILPEADAKKLDKAGLKSTTDLYKKAARSSARRKLAKATGIDLKKLTAWVKLCDLMRLKGVGPEMAKLLVAGKVTSVAKLKRHKAGSLHKRLMKANAKAKITENPPSEKYIADWIAQAKKLKK